MATRRRGRQTIVGILIIPVRALLWGWILSVERLLHMRLRIKTTCLIRLLVLRRIGIRLISTTIYPLLTTHGPWGGLRGRWKCGSGPRSARLWQLSSGHSR